MGWGPGTGPCLGASAPGGWVLVILMSCRHTAMSNHLINGGDVPPAEPASVCCENPVCAWAEVPATPGPSSLVTRPPPHHHASPFPSES